MSIRKRKSQLPSATTPNGQAVLERLAARGSELEFCKHDPERFAMWISTRPDQLPGKFCYQAAQVLAEDVSCGAHACLCGSCADLDLDHTGKPG